MTNRDIRINIVADDNASRVFNNIRLNASSMSTSLMSSLNGIATGYIGFDKALRSYNASMYRFNRVANRAVTTIGNSIYNFTKDAINNFSELEQQHAKTMGAMATGYDKTAEAQKRFLNDSKKLKQQALNLGTVGPNGKGSLNTVTDVSYAQTALIKSGMTADQILNSNAVESILKFAGGNDLSIDEATTFAVNLGTVFNKPVEQWGEMLDMVTKAADISVIDVEDIMQSLTYTGGIASGLGRDLEEVLGVISVMGQAGLRGRVAGTGLQAFFTRILSAGELTDTQIGNAPSEYVGQMYNAFVAESVNADGTFKDMDEVAELLDTAMESLNDQEQAWFAKKLFGLYQMKAAYALTGSVDGDENLITDFINQIANESSGANDIKYELMQGSQYGKIQSLKNAWEGIKTDVGDRLSPVVSNVSDQLFKFLEDPQNYKFDWTSLRNSISESGSLLSEKYGEEIGKAIENIGNFGVDSAQIAGALTPYAGGIAEGFTLLLNGDIGGALEAFKGGIEDTNENIDDLPPELRDSAEAARNVIIAFTNLAALNFVTTLAQPISAALTAGFKLIKALTATITATNSNVTATNATTVNIASVQLMNVTAAVVNVFGGGGTGTGGGGGGGTTPMLPSGSGGTPLLPSGTGGTLLLPGAALGAGATITGGRLLLGSGAAGTGTGSIINMYKFGGTYMTAHDILAKIGGIAGKGLTLAAILGFAKANVSPGLFDSQSERAQDGSDWLDRYVFEGNTDYNRIAGNARVYDWTKEHPDYNGSNNYEIVEAEMTGRTEARNEMMAFYMSGEGSALLNDLFAAQIEENSKITEEFLAAITTWTNSDGYTYTGSNEDIKAILDFMYTNFDSDYKDSWTYNGRFNEKAINNFLSNNPIFNGGIGMSGPITLTPNIMSTSEYFDKYSNPFNNILEKFGDMTDKMQSPTINVSVTTNVDKSGNATTTVNKNVGIDFMRRTSQYGHTNMIN